MRGDQGPTQETSARLVMLRDVILNAMQAANMTVMRLESVEERVDGASADLLQTDWTDVRQKEPADQLVTAAKDLKGYAQEQIVQSLSLHEALSTTLEQITINMSTSSAVPYGHSSVAAAEMRDVGSSSVKLPPSCAAALLQQIRHMPELLFRPPAPPKTSPPVLELEEEEEEDIPAWYTDPDFLSGNYGTPDRGFPVFREEEWVDMDEDYARDDYHASQTTSAETRKTTAKTLVTPGGIDRYFGVNKSPKKQRPFTKKRTATKTGDFP